MLTTGALLVMWTMPVEPGILVFDGYDCSGWIKLVGMVFVAFGLNL